MFRFGFVTALFGLALIPLAAGLMWRGGGPRGRGGGRAPRPPRSSAG